MLYALELRLDDPDEFGIDGISLDNDINEGGYLKLKVEASNNLTSPDVIGGGSSGGGGSPPGSKLDAPMKSVKPAVEKVNKKRKITTIFDLSENTPLQTSSSSRIVYATTGGGGRKRAKTTGTGIFGHRRGKDEAI